MQIITTITLGLIVAALARWLGFARGPAAWKAHLRWAGLLGSSVAGAILGGEIAVLTVVGRTAEPARYVMSLGGAMMVVALYEALSYRSVTP
jgi:uncharacterized membrane protein YeaQ/YmgE (transglycosylase-associated protein family)